MFNRLGILASSWEWEYLTHPSCSSRGVQHVLVSAGMWAGFAVVEECPSCGQALRGAQGMLALERVSGPEFSAQLPEARSHTTLPAKKSP